MEVKKAQQNVRDSLKAMFDASCPSSRKKTKIEYDASIRVLRSTLEDRKKFSEEWNTKEVLEAQERITKATHRLAHVEQKLKMSTDTAEIKDLEAQAMWCKTVVRQAKEIIKC